MMYIAQFSVDLHRPDHDRPFITTDKLLPTTAVHSRLFITANIYNINIIIYLCDMNELHA